MTINLTIPPSISDRILVRCNSKSGLVCSPMSLLWESSINPACLWHTYYLGALALFWACGIRVINAIDRVKQSSKLPATNNRFYSISYIALLQGFIAYGPWCGWQGCDLSYMCVSLWKLLGRWPDDTISWNTFDNFFLFLLTVKHKDLTSRCSSKQWF